MARLKLYSPWMIYYKELETFFQEDPHVRVILDEENMEIKVYVEGENKYDALGRLIPDEKTFGNVTLKITLVPANPMHDSEGNLFERAFQDNPVLSYVKEVKGIFGWDATYVVFKNRVVQYENDSIGDVNGLCSTLYQEIAKDIFTEMAGVFYCTDVLYQGENLGEPLGEWP